MAGKIEIDPVMTDLVSRERDEEKWNPVFLNNHATTETPEHDDVSIKRHHALGNIKKGVRPDAFRDTKPGGDRRSGEPRRRWLAKLPRHPFNPQKEALSLIS